jgi:16S rRNA (adenine1518-N6/adenine1519-N6)-dimethyltransferase
MTCKEKREESNSTYSFKETLLRRCEDYGIRLDTNIGQHLLVDSEVIRKMIEFIPAGARVIEIGAGPGQITEAVLEKNTLVVAIEIDRRFAPFLDSLKQGSGGRLEVIYGNALNQNWRRLTDTREEEKVWLIGSLPYHITEPLMATITELPIAGAVFLTGARFSSEIEAFRRSSSSFGKLTLLVNTFFRVEVVSEVDKVCFYPKPRTNSKIIFLVPRDDSEYLENETLFIFRQLFLGSSRSPLVKNALKEALIEYEEIRVRQRRGKKEGNRFLRRQIRRELKMIVAGVSELINAPKDKRKPLMTQNEARRIIEDLKLPEYILNKPLEQLNNQELRILFDRLREKFGLPFE